MQAASQKTNENLTLKAYEKKVKDDIRLINENLFEMMKLFKIEDDRTLKVITKNYFFNLITNSYFMFSDARRVWSE